MGNMALKNLGTAKAMEGESTVRRAGPIPACDILSNFPRVQQLSAAEIQRQEERRQKVVAGVHDRDVPDTSTQQLPPWKGHLRSLPNVIVRSALFNARNRKTPRATLKNQNIEVIGEGIITYTGEELRQDDETVWLQLLQLAQPKPAGEVITFVPYAFCRAVGWGTDSGSYERLRECLTRMQATSLKIVSGHLGEGVSLSMIPLFRWQDATGKNLSRYEVSIAPGLVEVFGDNHFTLVEWKQRLALPVGIATWLHGYLASHRQPLPVKIETIKRGSGITTEKPAHVQAHVERALEALGKVGFLKSWRISNGLVKVQRV